MRLVTPPAVREAWSKSYLDRYKRKIAAQVRDSAKMENAAVRSAIRAINDVRKEVLGTIASVAPEKFKAFHARELRGALDETLGRLETRLQTDLIGAQNVLAEKGLGATDDLLGTMGIEVPAVFVPEELLAIAGDFSADLITGLTNEARNRINRIINSAAIRGAPTHETMKEIGRNLTDPSVFRSIAVRAETITRTEVIRVRAMARHARLEQAKEVVPKLEHYWLAVIDARTRPEHVEADRDYNPHGGRIGPIPIDEPFVVGGEKLMFPRDPAGSAGNTINCVLDGQVPVLTDSGWKRIMNIEPGMRVMTHAGRFKKVEKTSRRPYKGEAVSIHFRHTAFSNQFLSVTPEHPFLVGRRWAEAGKIKRGMKVKMLASRCQRCGKKIPYYRKYCSRTCLSKDITDRQWSNPDHRKKMSEKASEQLRREYATGERDRFEIGVKARAVGMKKYPGGYVARPEINSKGRDAIRKKYGSQRECLSQKALPAVLAKVHGGTAIEEALASYLRRRGVKFERQFRVKRFFTDFFVPEWKMFVEADGKHWHQDRERERSRDLKILLEYPDHKIAHVTYGDEKRGKKPNWEVFDLVKLNHAGAYEFIDVPVESVRRWRPKRKLWAYNFSVESDESYIIKGIVSHNCRCLEVPFTPDAEERVA